MPDGLNAAQRAAVKTLSGPLLVLAGAGTGKTRVVTFRIAELIKQGTRADRILAVTFTNKAAREMHERARQLLGKRLKQQPEISTFHSLCVRILRRHAPRLGYPTQFAIYDRGDQESVARTALREIKVSDQHLRPGDLIHFIGGWKTLGVQPEVAAAQANSDQEHLAALAYRRYQRTLKQAGAVDFDDLLLCTNELFTRFADARAAEANRFSHLLIDEYQDTNALQYRIVRALAGGHRNLCVVGDDDQSIYGWRGADVSHILRFQKDWPGAKVVRLEENYRSTPPILALANRLIVHNKTRHDKVLRPVLSGGEKPQIWQCQDEVAEAKRVVDDIRARIAAGSAQPKDFAILFRTNEQPRLFETELRKTKTPYVLLGGMSFFDRREVRDILAYVRVIAMPQDEVSLRRIINTPARGIGTKALTALGEAAVARGKSIWDVMSAAEMLPGLPSSSAEAVRKFVALVNGYRARAEKGSLVDAIGGLVNEIGYRDEINRNYDEPLEQQSRWSAVEETFNALGTYEKRAKQPTLASFLDEIALGDRDESADKDEQLARNAVALLTLHSAKGLEYPQVYLVGMEEGLLPHRRSVEAAGAAIDEERRLCYVGVTRAQRRLTISLALARMKWGKPRESIPSRFLFELTGQADSSKPPERRADRASARAAGPRVAGLSTKPPAARPAAKPKRKTGPK
ncbi:MAG: UvrD-helicase domain-containing protein [Pirellulales bacterium]